MKNSKAAVDVITSILIVMIALGLTATAYTWGLPLIQKQQDTAVVGRVASYFDQNNQNSLPSSIEFIANNGGEQTFAIDATGVWILHPCPSGELPSCNPSPDDITNNDFNSIEFTFFSKVSNIASKDEKDRPIGFISLTPGAECSLDAGILGKDKSSVVCAKAEPFEDGFQITYKVWFRELSETIASRGFKIDLTKHQTSLYSSAGKTIRISREANNQVAAGDKTLIIPEMKILLE